MTQTTENDPAQLRADIHKSLTERMEWFMARYDVVKIYAFHPGSERVYLGDKANDVKGIGAHRSR
ncbi:hypothetical protein HNP55_001691 [Paucibacter oligotrophus]|uniref:Uncharacterized protein n=1 Tax=Roseateles oligotrophus TaxID=1769250 RepID=A0A840L926_9BURK|nr:hypothetical protein [Roseateles oligotrophus]MBB4843172.1 hypothetical protein [Roseateles oligotrophus]